MPDDWSRPAMEAAVENGLLTGDGSGRLMPEKMLTRAELAAIVTRAFGASISGDLSAYGDISTNAWYYAELGRAIHMGVLNVTGGTVDPNGPVTRQEAFTAVARMLDLEDGTGEVCFAIIF